MNIKPRANITLESLATIERGNRVAWPTLGQMLDEVDANGYWAAEGTRSFTEWLQRFSKRSGMGVAILWRILSGARFYQILQKDYPELDLKPLNTISSKVSPDHFELLSKLSRVMSRSEFKAQLGKVLDGTTTRARLRDTWHAFRPVLAGRNARGRGQTAPRANPRDPVQIINLTEARIYQAIAATGPGWTGIQKPALYRLLLQTGPAQIPGSSERYVFDAIAMLQEKPQSAIQVHGVEFMSINRIADRKLEALKASMAFYDYAWVATIEPLLKKEANKLPARLGILLAGSSRIDIVRSAERIDGDPVKQQAMLRALLAQTLRG